MLVSWPTLAFMPLEKFGASPGSWMNTRKPLEVLVGYLVFL
jgi:hypothetical protein